jgi:hypothetical protein
MDEIGGSKLIRRAGDLAGRIKQSQMTSLSAKRLARFFKLTPVPPPFCGMKPFRGQPQVLRLMVIFRFDDAGRGFQCALLNRPAATIRDGQLASDVWGLK